MEKDSIEIVKYNPDYKEVWNEFVESSKNGTFLFNRGYMDYHSDRFEDYSFLIFRKNSLYCLLPANIQGDTVFSHQGLTYGGLIMNQKNTAEGILKVFGVLKDYLRGKNIKNLVYKPIPHQYHLLPAEEDLYALFRYNAKLKARNLSSVILQKNRIPFSTLRRRMVKKADSSGLTVGESGDFFTFWEILKDNLQKKYNALPVHTYHEIKYLAALFPQIKLFCATKDGKMLGGVLCYFTGNVIRVQYISANQEGKDTGAIDAIFNYLLNKECYQNIPYFDFGTSNEDEGRFLNETLIYQKEGFGGRGICYDTWEMEI